MRTPCLLPLPIFALATLALALAGCEPTPENVGVQRDTTNQTATQPLPFVDKPLDRPALLRSVAEAGSAAALGRDDREAQRQLAGALFEVHIRFGCPAESEATGNGPFQVEYDAEKRTLRLRAAPSLAGKNWFATLGGPEVEAVEGFWLPRPWLLTDGCPAPSVDESAKGPAPAIRSVDASDDLAGPTIAKEAAVYPRVGLAQLFMQTDARTRRRDHRPYETTISLAADQQPSREGYTLILSGRLRQVADDRVIACRAVAADEPPECIVSVSFDRVRIERPDSRQVLAEWSS